MAAEDTPKVASAAGWKKAAKHTIRVPSGEYVAVVIPDLGALIKEDKIPQNLLEAALGAAGAAGGQDKPPTKDDIINDVDFTNKLVQLTVVEPSLSDTDIAGIPVEDKVLIAEIATRQRDLDAEGNHIGGLQKSEDFRKFRGLGEFDEALASL